MQSSIHKASSIHCPRILTCGHTFCEKCLQTLFQRENENHDQKPLECPVCRRQYKADKLNKVDQIPKNYALIPDMFGCSKPSLNEFLSSLDRPTAALSVYVDTESSSSCNIMSVNDVRSNDNDSGNGNSIIMYCELCMGDTDDSIEEADSAHAASYECLECNEKMCDIAAKYHNKLMKHHQLIRLIQKRENNCHQKIE
jgi:hypothetical protein